MWLTKGVTSPWVALADKTAATWRRSIIPEGTFNLTGRGLGSRAPVKRRQTFDLQGHAILFRTNQRVLGEVREDTLRD